MKITKVIILLILLVVLIVVVVQNTAPVQARFFWLTAEIPAVVLLFLTAVVGFILGLIVALLIKNGKKSKERGNRE
jgi:uncharacterized integral membrane protein